jgi:hypothetical protein
MVITTIVELEKRLQKNWKLMSGSYGNYWIENGKPGKSYRSIEVEPKVFHRYLKKQSRPVMVEHGFGILEWKPAS